MFTFTPQLDHFSTDDYSKGPIFSAPRPLEQERNESEPVVAVVDEEEDGTRVFADMLRGSWSSRVPSCPPSRALPCRSVASTVACTADLLAIFCLSPSLRRTQHNTALPAIRQATRSPSKRPKVTSEPTMMITEITT